MKNNNSFMEDFREAGFTLESVREQLAHGGGSYYEYIFSLIERASEIEKFALEPWEWRSLTEYAECEVVRDTHWVRFAAHTQRGPLSLAEQLCRDGARRLAQAIHGFLWSHEEGLLLYVKEGGEYKEINAGSPAGNFALGLLKYRDFPDDYHRPPAWANEIFVNKRAEEVYGWFHYDDGGGPSEAEKAFRRQALAAKKTAIRAILEGRLVIGDTGRKRPQTAPASAASRERNTLHQLVGILAAMNRLDLESPYKAAGAIAAESRRRGAPISDETIAQKLKLAASLIGPRPSSGHGR